MYKIIKNGKIIEIQSKLNWAKYQHKNNIFISCSKAEGQVILCGAEIVNLKTQEIHWQPNSVIYNVSGKPSIGGYETVEIEKIEWYTISEKHRADIDYVAIMAGVDLDV